ncbi:MAG: hypothetical protein Q8R47_01640 [Nanoarchaeota archaeon]|nr:hypothetical protein [Nanoarchaeota archaeon]
MRLNKVGVISLLLISLLLASCAPAPGPSAGVWETILEIGSLGFLCERGWFGLGPCNYENNLVALMRVLIGILVFALLYMGTSAVRGLKENRNIAITVSIILAIMSVIFIPDALLLAIGTAYATITLILLILLFLAPLILLFIIIPGDSRRNHLIRVFLLIALYLLLTGLKNTAGGLV